MALVKTSISKEENLEEIETLLECLTYFQTEEEIEKKYYALDKMKEFDGAGLVFLSILFDGEVDPKYTSYVASILGKIKLTKDIFDGLFSLLEFENAHIRNLAIEIIQEQGNDVEEFFEDYLTNEDRDVRIFIANILGNTKLKKSREYLLKLIENEKDINICMTAVDYLGEIGEPEDIEFLKELKERFSGDFYAEFAINNAIEGIGEE
ncbi:MAG: HEAT repeat domain-containing protein [Campylobacterales bacterium]|nr:HEAT repeat domain-containing protein [Campylobacterales bacterium]